MRKKQNYQAKDNLFKREKGQTILEYSCVIAACALGLILMINYFNRSIQGKLKESVDAVGREFVGSGPAISESSFRLSPQTQVLPRADLFKGGSGEVSKKTTGFTYEGRRGFAVSVRHSVREESAEIEGVELSLE